ncbi:conjugal transfer protein MobA [Chryseobacterium indologenes]|uniref:conjugal transfer protein MobA n=1 Tax=Chryseobacterium indologenes TaxID=253 RepID=UPI0022E7851C|nr:conjugal transfer protein MobA [Chryseobacterium indologenes]
MEEKNRNQIKKAGRKPKIDPAVHRYSFNLNDEDNAKFLALFDQSGMKITAHFITACIFQKTVKTVKIDMDAIEYHEKLTRFFSQFRAIGTNYNQIVKILYRNFSEKKAGTYLFKLEKETIELVKITKEVIRLTQEFEEKYLKKE